MAVIKTKIQYSDSILNHADSLAIIAKCEKLAKKYFLDFSWVARVDSDGRIFYDISVWIPTAQENKVNPSDGHYMYIWFQFVPKEYFGIKHENWNQLINQYPPEGESNYNTIMGKILDLLGCIKPDYESVKTYLDTLYHAARMDNKKRDGKTLMEILSQ